MGYQPNCEDGDVDEYLNQALIYLRQRWFELSTGFVSCVIKDKQNVVFSTNTFEEGGKIIHAEHNCIDLFEQKYGEISKDAIIIVTLSPCIVYSKNRIGPSCSSLLLDRGIKRLHFGYLHEKQGNLATYENFGFVPSVTKNSRLLTICGNLLNLYLSNKENLMVDMASWLRVKKQVGSSIFNFDYK